MSENKKRKNILPAILLIVFLAIVCVIAFGIYNNLNNDVKGVKQPDKEYNLVIEKKDFENEIAKKLKSSGVIVNTTLWTNWMASHYPDFKYINGEYKVNANMSYEQLAKKLQNPDISHKSVKVAIPEGYNIFEIAQRLEKNQICSKKDFLNACKSKEGYNYDFLESIPDNNLIAYQLEGFLFPATYDLAQNSSAKDVVEEMLDAFENRYSDDMKEFCKKNNMTLYQLITLSSIVQEEAFTNESAANIASVFMNRLNKGAKLQSDVTFYYAKTLRDDYGFSQKTYDAYYTYRCDGLPAGPVSNPGLDIINATVNYPKTDYLYFFSDLNKQFHFAKTYDEFVKLQDKYPWKE